MFKKVLFCFLSLFFISDLLSAQDASIKGVLSINEEPVTYCNVVIKELNKGTYSNEKGFYSISNLKPDSYTIVISSVGYRTLSKTIQITEGVNEFNFEMVEDPLNLDRVVVSASRNEQFQYRAPVIVSQVTDQTFESTQALALSEGLNFSPGLRVENNCQNCGFTQVRMNGLGGAYSQILINSRPVFSALAGVYGLDMIPTNMIDRVEVVRGGGSALYGGNAIAGTINIITKDPIKNSFQLGVNQALTNFEKPDRTLFFNGSIVNDEGNAGINLYGYNREREPWDANGDGFSEIVKLNNTTFGMDAFYKLTDRDRLELNVYSINEYRRGGNKFELEPHQTDITEELDHNILGVGLSYEHFSKKPPTQISSLYFYSKH